MLHWVSKVAREFAALQELIFFCPEDDTKFIADIEQQLKGRWKDRWKGDGDHAKACGLLAHWKVPKVTSMVYKPDYPSPQT
jgi:hypothetical protein